MCSSRDFLVIVVIFTPCYKCYKTINLACSVCKTTYSIHKMVHRLFYLKINLTRDAKTLNCHSKHATAHTIALLIRFVQ